MPHPSREPIYDAIKSIRLIDPHTHINPHSPASSTLADLLGYHYYTELAHSAGMPKQEIEQDGLQPRELVRRLVTNLGPLENTAQYKWLIEICRTFFGFDGDRLDESNWEAVYDAAENQMQSAEWPQMVLDQSNVEAVFLTNDFDDDLKGFDTNTYIPCLRTDDLVFHLAKYQTRQRLEACTGISLDGSLVSLRDSLKQLFERFVAAGARACAISLPPSFQPTPVSDGRAATALDEIIRKGALADEAHQVALSRRVFWTLAELCDEFGLPFDLMIGVNRGVYAGGVYQGQDLYDSRVSLIQYRELFNSFPQVKFPISVLASVTNQELVSYAWIFPNVITNGHWWYSNTPSFIAKDAAARLEAVPQTKQIGYYSDAYKLEFVYPKFDMYRRILSRILADEFVGENGWSEERAIELGHQVLRGNVDRIFPRPASRPDPMSTWVGPSPASSASSAALAAGAIGTVEVGESAESLNEGLTEFSTVESDFIDADSDDDAAGNMETVIEDIPGPRIGGEPDEVLSQLEKFHAESELPDRPTVIELETVKEDTVEESVDDVEIVNDLNDEPIHSSNIETVEESLSEEDLLESGFSPLDPIPSHDEIGAVDVTDVELHDGEAGEVSPDAETIEDIAEADLLDVGDLLGEDDERPSAEIRMLRGESPFTPDEDSLKLESDPATGELIYPIEGEKPADDLPDADGPADDDQVV